MPKCRATTSRGTPCLAFARPDDPDGLCVFHSHLPKSADPQRDQVPLSQEQLLRMIDMTIRQVRSAKGLTPLERSRELRALLVERAKLTEGPDEGLSLADRLNRAKS